MQTIDLGSGSTPGSGQGCEGERPALLGVLMAPVPQLAPWCGSEHGTEACFGKALPVSPLARAPGCLKKQLLWACSQDPRSPPAHRWWSPTSRPPPPPARASAPWHLALGSPGPSQVAAPAGGDPPPGQPCRGQQVGEGGRPRRRGGSERKFH